MMLGATSTTVVSHWMLRRLTTSYTSVSWVPSQPPQFILTSTLLTIGSCRRCWMSGPLQSFYLRSKHSSNSSSSKNIALLAKVQRIQSNVARLYARRILDIAMASAALQRYKQQQLEQVTLLQGTTTDRAVERPLDWENWQRKEFQNELLQEIGSSTIHRLWSAAQRIVSLSCLMVPFAVLYPLSYVSPTVHDVTWKYALWSIEQAGPTFIKLFQWATTRQDLFSTQFCQYFSSLQDHTIGHQWYETLQILQQDLLLPLLLDHQSSSSSLPTSGITAKNNSSLNHSATALLQSRGGSSTNKDVEKALLDVNEYITLHPKPIGSGCIAQVYYGTLRKPIGQYHAGTEIAVKVQHPGIVHKVCVDFYILDIFAKVLESIPYINLSYLSLIDTVHKFRDIMIPQLDLSIEAKHLQRFNRDFHHDSNVTFPKPIAELTTPRVLTETFIHGTPILQYVTASEADRKELALLGLNTTLKMIFIHDFLHGTVPIIYCEHCFYQPQEITHVLSPSSYFILYFSLVGDLHPGNILVSRDTNVSGHPLRLHLLDCGLVVEMGPEQHVNLVKILGAFARRNGRLAGQLMVDTSSNCQASPVDIELFVKGIEHIVTDDENNNFLEKVGDYITDICYLACQKKVKLEASFINAALAVEIMEGIATALYPDLKVTKIALPLVVQAELMHRLPKMSLW